MSRTELSESTTTLVASTVPILEEQGVAITARMYERLFASQPELRALFSGPTQDQAERLASAVLAYAENITDLTPLLPAVTAIASKHVAASVDASYYAIVGRELLGAMVDVLGELPVEIVDAWSEAYDHLASLFIEIEAGLSAAA